MTTVSPPNALGYFDNDTKGYHLLGNLVDFHSSHKLRDASTVTTVMGMSIDSAFGFFCSVTVCVATL